MLKAHEIAIILNELYEGVERSKCGKIISTNEIGKPEIQTVAYNTFLYLVSNIFPKQLDMKIPKDEK